MDAASRATVRRPARRGSAGDGRRAIVATAALLAILALGSASGKAMPAAAAGAAAAATAAADGRFLAFCYHDITTRRSSDPHAVEETAFVQQIEFLRSQKAHFLSIDELLAAKRGAAPLPPNSVLLTFDDGCRSFRTKVLPVLELYRIPAVLSVVTSWTDETDADCEGGVMGAKELAEVAHSPFVEFASHSHDLHHSVRINPQGSTNAAATSRVWRAEGSRYETEAEYRARLARDLRLSAATLAAKFGRRPRVMTWPYGAYNAPAVEAAHQAGYQVLLTIRDDIYGGVGRLSDLDVVPRRMLLDHPTLNQFMDGYWAGGPSREMKPVLTAERVVHADLDLLYDPGDPGATNRNVDRFIERMVAMQPSAVYLQAFADPAGTGNVSEVYFPNRVLPVRADLFSFVARSLQVRQISVYAWMPSLSYVLPDPEQTARLSVRTLHAEAIAIAHKPYRRLSPFSDEARRTVAQIFEDLARGAPISGVLFQDDAYLDEDEDFHPEAIAALRALGVANPAAPMSVAQRRAWTQRKTRALDDWVEAMIAAVRLNQPLAQSVRTLYAPVLTDPESVRWFAQDYAAALQAHDEVVVMAYPRMEGIDAPLPWLRRLVDEARAKGGLAKTVFKLQTVDWKKGGACIPAQTVAEWMHTLVAAGAIHLAYYPDNVFDDCPRLSAVREHMSTEEFPATSVGSDARRETE